ncbi:electrogenic sodium bicarbonate cotransporter 1-like [Oncorhynchus keta]|nr:electrogenic sodium bicarbonate cotransporter 1-like [Oncorhynchus keta]
MVVRKMMDLMFSQHDLAWLDDILPEKDKKKEKGGKKKKDNKKTKAAAETESDEEEKNVYSSVNPDNIELDRRYCVLKLHVPYSDLIQPAITHTD